MPVVKYMVRTQVNAGRKMVPQNMGSQECAGPAMCGAGNVRGRECAGPCTGSGRGEKAWHTWQRIITFGNSVEKALT